MTAQQSAPNQPSPGDQTATQLGSTAAPIVQHIWCSATITKKMEDVFIGFILMQAQNKSNISEYVVYLSTLGGSPFSAINLHTFMKSIPQKTTVYNMGAVVSAGVPFFLAFNERYGVPQCNFGPHQTWISRSVLPEQLNVSELETQRSGLAATDKKTQQIILEATVPFAKKKLTLTSIKQAFVNSTTYNASEALELGFITKVEAPNLPDTGVLYLTDQYLATLPG